MSLNLQWRLKRHVSASERRKRQMASLPPQPIPKPPKWRYRRTSTPTRSSRPTITESIDDPYRIFVKYLHRAPERIEVRGTHKALPGIIAGQLAPKIVYIPKMDLVPFVVQDTTSTTSSSSSSKSSVDQSKSRIRQFVVCKCDTCRGNGENLQLRLLPHNSANYV